MPGCQGNGGRRLAALCALVGLARERSLVDFEDKICHKIGRICV